MNMSYCQFENTSADVAQCLDSMQDEAFDVDNLSSEYERAGFKRFIALCRVVASLADEMELDWSNFQTILLCKMRFFKINLAFHRARMYFFPRKFKL